jgi:hypothetical protein
MSGSVIEATREASRAAHRWRDAAASQYGHRNFGLASHAKKQKEDMYRLKEKGIISAHKSGLLRYVVVSPQGMAVYEYDEGGMSCFHSCLHPRGAARLLVPDHPEVLLVAARRARLKMMNVIRQLSSLPEPGEEYERSVPPRREQRITCWTCGLEGHMSWQCDLAEEDE